MTCGTITPMATFDPTDTYSYTCTSAAVSAPFTNTAHACGTPPIGTEVCDDDDANVGLEHLSSYQDLIPKDFAILSLELFNGACTGTPLILEEVPVSGPGTYNTANAQLLSALINSNLTAGTYNWRITYHGDTTGVPDIDGACGTENFTITNGADAT